MPAARGVVFGGGLIFFENECGGTDSDGYPIVQWGVGVCVDAMAVISTDDQENRTRKVQLRIIFRPYRANYETVCQPRA